jgi:HSP20 family protein
MRALTPSAGSGLRREMDLLFERFFEPPWVEAPAMGEWTPALDVTEGKDAITVKAELPGVEPKEISVTLEGNTLTIRGEKEEKKEEKDEHGIVTITLPRAAGAKGTTIPLKAE